jgi:hypothetical protein
MTTSLEAINFTVRPGYCRAIRKCSEGHTGDHDGQAQRCGCAYIGHRSGPVDLTLMTFSCGAGSPKPR